MLSIFKVIYDKRLYIGLTVIVLVTVITGVALDKWIMPAYTNYNTSVTVPDVTKMSMNEASARLQSRGLRYEILDKRANETFPPNFVIDQNPLGNAMVKPNRKIYLTVNAPEIPMVVVPNVTNLSLRNAEIQLQNFGLKVGNISYASSRFKNSVLSQSVPAGTSIRRGSTVNLIVSDGLGMNKVRVPEIVGMRLAEAQRAVRQAGLRVGSIQYERTSEIEPNHIIGFNPAEADTLFEGETIDLIVSELIRAQESEERGAVIIDSTDSSTPDSLRLKEKPPTNDE